MKKTTVLFTIVATAALLVGSPAANAVNLNLSTVRPLDTFSFEIVGSNSTSGIGYTLGPVETGIFGTATTFTGAGVDGQNYTVTSSETSTATTTTDTITVSTPTNFINEATYNGVTITALTLNIGMPNTLDFLTALTGVTTTGTGLYSTASTITLSPQTTLSNGATSLSASEGINSSTTAITGFTVRSFTYSISYAVPEPSTWAMMGLGLVAGAVVVRRRMVA